MTSAPRTLSALLLLGLLALFALGLDARRLRGAREGHAAESAHVLGLSDLALSSSARWLRHPSQAEPAAATSDAPYPLDVDPAGGVLPRPSALYDATTTRSLERRPAR